MPSWKKVITSGSNASLSSLSVTNAVTASIVSASSGITGSLFGTASWSSNTLTASYVNPLRQNVLITGSLLVTQSYISRVDWIDFTSASDQPVAAARLGWNDSDGTLSLGLKGGNVDLLIGEAEFAYAYNAEATTLTKGTVVYISGSQGNRIAVKRAAATNDANSAGTLGFVAEAITAGTTGIVITNGVFPKLNTSGLTAGALLFLSSSAGEYSTTAPQAPLHAVRLGYVERVSATVGSIFVKVDNGYELGELHDVVDTTTTASYGDLLVKSGSVWINSKQLTGSYGLTGSLTATRNISAASFTGSLFGTASWATNTLTASYVNTLNQNVIITGSLGVGISSIGPNENTLTLGARDAASEGGQIGFNAPGGTYTSASFIDNWQNKARILKGNNTTSTGLIAQWDIHTTQMQLPGYTNASSFPGTATANLAVDSGGNVITVSTSGGSVFPYTGNAVITGSLTTTGIIYAQPNGGMYFQGGDDAALYDINISNHMGIYGVQNSTVGAIKLGSNGPVLYGSGSSLGIGTTTPTSGTLQVNGNVFATSFTGSLQGTASWAVSASWAPGGSTPGGSNTQIQFNSGSAFKGTGSFTFNYLSQSLQQGNGAVASGLYSHAQGVGSIAYANYSHAEGDGTIASGSYSHAEGAGSIASGSASHAEGTGTRANGDYSHAEGDGSQARGYGSHAEGNSTIASGDYSHAEGITTTASGAHSHAEGDSTFATGDYSHAEGNSAIASGYWSHAEGSQTFAEGYYSHAEGSLTIAHGSYSHAEGVSTVAIGDSSHAEGYITSTGQYGYDSLNTAPGEYRLDSIYGDVTGQFTSNYIILDDTNISDIYGKIALLINSASWDGTNTYVSLVDPSIITTQAYIGIVGVPFPSLANTYISGLYAHSEGQVTQAVGDYSHTQGYYTVAVVDGQTVVGKYNLPTNDQSAFIIGNGTANGSRSNLLLASGSEVQITGSLIASGSTYIQGLIDTAQSNVVTIDTATGQLYYTASSAIGGGGGGSSFPYTGSAIISGSLTVTGSLRVTQGITGSLFGTASWATNALTASSLAAGTYNITASWANNTVSSSYPFRVSGSTIYSAIDSIPTLFNPQHSIFIGSSAGMSATNASQSVFLGRGAGDSATSAYHSNFLGYQAGKGADTSNNSNFFGYRAGTAVTKANNSNFFGSEAGVGATNAAYSNMFGSKAGTDAVNANNSNFFGTSAGLGASNAGGSNFIGVLAGNGAAYASQSNFIGIGAGDSATNADNSNFIGTSAGSNAFNAAYSNFSGYQAGYRAISASYSTLIGYNTGYAPSTADSIWSHNIIIGTNISLPANTSRQLNIGGVLFGTGLYNATSGNPFTGSQTQGRIGVNTLSPSYSLDVSGSGNFTNNLTVTGSLNISGSINILKAGALKNTDFSSTPKVASVTFTTAFANDQYAISLTGTTDARIFTVQSKTAAGFTVTANSSVDLTGDVYWIATPFNS